MTTTTVKEIKHEYHSTYKGFKVFKGAVRLINVHTGRVKRGYDWIGHRDSIELSAPTLKRLKFEIDTDPGGFNQLISS